jgi:hypothetical protein
MAVASALGLQLSPLQSTVVLRVKQHTYAQLSRMKNKVRKSPWLKRFTTIHRQRR